jgi:rod shape-determining protein MreD
MGEYLGRPWIRLVLVGLVAVVVQTTVVPEFSIAGAHGDLMLLMSVVGGAVGGPEKGALSGFVFGTLFDLVLITPFGLSPLVYGAAGFVTGYVQAVTIDPTWWLLSLVTAVGSALGAVTYAVAGAIVGLDGMVSTRLITVALVVGFTNAVAAPLVAPVLRWCLRVRRSESVKT